ncbi:MAG: hypothetical protein U9R08_03475 [Nanoarchaeota archaeon]|nr:hypothetical protein [Nanoarchaeota archaeon]
MQLLKKLITSSLVLILCIVSVYASYPDYEIVNNLKDEVTIDDDDLGTLIVLKRGYISENITVSDYGTFNAQQYDYIMWRGEGSIEIESPSGVIEVINNLSRYKVIEYGEYTYQSIYNSSYNGKINVEVAGQLDLSVISETDLNISHNGNIQIDNEETINFEIEVDSTDEAKDYELIVKFRNGKNDKQISHNVEIKSDSTWRIEEDTINDTVKISNNQYKKIGIIKIASNGNEDSSINIEVTGDGAIFINTLENIEIPKRSSTYVTVMAQIPEMQQNGKYNTTIKLSGENLTYKKNIEIHIMDTINPKINNISIDDVVIYHDSKITVHATDNIDVQRALISWGNGTHEMEKDQQFFHYGNKFKNPTKHLFTVCVYDASENKVCKKKNVTFVIMDIIKIIKRIDMHGTRVGKYAESIFMNMTEKPPEPVRVYLEEVNGNYNSTNGLSIRIRDGDGSIKKFEKVWEYIEVQHMGEIKLEILSENVTEYDVIIRVQTPKMIKNSSLISIKGKFLRYDIPEPFTESTYDGTLRCDIHDTGSLETSEQRCTFEFTASFNENVKDLIVPMTVDKRDELMNEINSTQRTMKHRTRNYVLIQSMTLGIVMFLCVTMFFAIKIHPYLRIKTGGD